jgi:S1-C subfamily serine protease
MPVTSFGNQAGAGGSPAVTSGVISGTGRTIEANDGASGFSETLHGMLATTARIEPGDSGGPLASAAGTVIGVDTAAGTGTGSAATGYAIPIAAAMAAERQIAAGRRGPGITIGAAGFLGVLVGRGLDRSPAAQATAAAAARSSGRSAQTVTAASVTPSCLPTKSPVRPPSAVARTGAGALVDAVLCGSPAAAAGISAGDVITAADGRAIASARALTSLISTSRPGTVISVTWVAATGSRRTALIRLTQAPAV